MATGNHTLHQKEVAYFEDLYVNGVNAGVGVVISTAAAVFS